MPKRSHMDFNIACALYFGAAASKEFTRALNEQKWLESAEYKKSRAEIESMIAEKSQMDLG